MKKIIINEKQIVVQIPACGECFARVEYEDEYCWNCGIALDGEAYSQEELVSQGGESDGK